MASIPPLEPHCHSWVIVARDNGQPVLETYERKTAEAVNQDRYEVITALQWLVRFDKSSRV